jgi:hypothetical protein
MSLYQKTAYIKPHGIVEVPHVPGTGTFFAASLFDKPGVRKNNTYDGYGVYPLNDQGVVSMMAADPVSPWGNYTNAGYRVITKADGTMDPIPFMEAMCYLSAFGVRDEGLSQAQLDLIARSRPVEMRCGPTMQFVRNCAAQVGVQVRQVHMLNVTQRNNFDDGHVAGEIKIDNAWALLDVPTDVAFKDAVSGDWLSMAEVFATGLDAVETVSLAETRCGAADYNLNPNWNQVFFEMKFRTQALAHEWRKRIYEVPGMFNPLTQGITWGLKPELWSYKAEVEAYSPLWTVIPFDEWVADYY